MTATRARFDALELTVFSQGVAMLAEEMGGLLERSSISPNIRERRDASCALFDADGRMVAQAAHIPVHLGAMPESVAAVRACGACGWGWGLARWSAERVAGGGDGRRWRWQWWAEVRAVQF